MDVEICANCQLTIQPGEKRTPWFVKNESNDVTERGSVHLNCPYL